jgi:FkbM family methyltransferase
MSSYLTSVLRRGRSILIGTLTSRHCYQSWSDFTRANWLRLTENHFTRPFTSPGTLWTLHLRNCPDPIYVRRANSDFHVVEEVFERGEYDPFLKMGIPPDATILDLGTNVGLMSVFFNMHFPGCRIVSVEPDLENFKMIQANCARPIESGRQKLFHGFAAARDGFASIRREGLSWSFSKSDAPGGEQISCYSVPTLCREVGFDTVDLLKCDIEGTEVELFADCAGWIGCVRNLFVETHAPYNPSQLQDDLRAAGWNFRVVTSTGSTIFLSQIQSVA